MNPQPAQTACFLCGKKIENNGFARLISGNTFVFLCSPKCALAYFNRLEKASQTSNDRRQSGSFETSPSWYDLDASLCGQDAKVPETPK